MAGPVPPLAFNTDFAPQTGHPVTVASDVVRITAPNAGPYTFKGTNSFIIGRERLFVVDPGPDDDVHLEALLAAIGARPVAAILLTHTHKDHSLLAPRLKAATGAPVWSGGRHRLSRARYPFEFNPIGRDSHWSLRPDRELGDGDIVDSGEMRLEVIATPGHCANHLAFGIAGTPWLLTGDHIMGWNSTLVAVPDGSMADYLGSLDRVIGLDYRHYLPAHGGEIADGPAYGQALRAHREMRNTQVIEAVGKGVTSLAGLQRAMYPTLAAELRAAARLTLKAHVEYLAGRGLIGAGRGLLGLRLFPVRS